MVEKYGILVNICRNVPVLLRKFPTASAILLLNLFSCIGILPFSFVKGCLKGFVWRILITFVFITGKNVKCHKIQSLFGLAQIAIITYTANRATIFSICKNIDCFILLLHFNTIPFILYRISKGFLPLLPKKTSLL